MKKKETREVLISEYQRVLRSDLERHYKDEKLKRAIYKQYSREFTQLLNKFEKEIKNDGKEE